MSNQRINLFYKLLDCFVSIFHVFAPLYQLNAFTLYIIVQYRQDCDCKYMIG